MCAIAPVENAVSHDDSLRRDTVQLSVLEFFASPHEQCLRHNRVAARRFNPSIALRLLKLALRLPRWRLERLGLPLPNTGNGQSLRVGFLQGVRLQIASVADASSKPLHRFLLRSLY